MNIDLYVKAFFKPLKLFTTKPTASYRIRAYTWIAHETDIKARSKISFDDALNKLMVKIFSV